MRRALRNGKPANAAPGEAPMRRRDVLALGASLIGTIAARRVLAQPDQPLVRAAVVIGVDQVGQGDEFPRLKAGASSAKNVAEWLSAEGFEVKTFLDTDLPVGIRAIKVVIKELVGRGTLDQLVVYSRATAASSAQTNSGCSPAPPTTRARRSVLDSVTTSHSRRPFPTSSSFRTPAGRRSPAFGRRT